MRDPPRGTFENRMRYISTRGGMSARPFCDILLEGLAPDGGLTLPETYPKLRGADLAQLRSAHQTRGYTGLALELMSFFIDDLPRATLQSLIDKAYTTPVFGTAAITPLKPLGEGIVLQQLSNGPTLAFKDMAMQFLGHAFEHVLGARNERLTILAATSGDTGSAAEYAMRGKRGIEVFMLSPAGRMSAFQRAQMYSLPDANIHNIAVEGVFDDCQDIVKTISSDLEFKARYRLGTVNSINWGRVVAQIVYYFAGYFLATRSNDQAVSFAVPSGNFGNIMAGHIAREMGLPIKTLVLATNENNVLADFFNSGVYRPRGSEATYATSSPSMDISKASNFERFVFDLVGRDSRRLNALWKHLAETGAFNLAGWPEFQKQRERFGFVAGTSTHADRLTTIRDTWAQNQTLIDTHTADGLKVAREHVEAGVPMIVLETALPVKFADTIKEALGFEPPLSTEQSAMMALPQRVTTVAKSAHAVRDIIAARLG